MSHLLDIENIYDKLTLLQHVVYGSEHYCRKRLTGSEHDIGNGAIDEYWGWVKSIVSSYTLECSIRLRVLLDTVRDEPEGHRISELDNAARAGLTIGQIAEGDFDLTLRETCNKIIHARKVIPVWTTGYANDVEFKYWSGDFDLSGTNRGESWQLILHIAPWAICTHKFLEDAEAAELTMNVGQDWY